MVTTPADTPVRMPLVAPMVAIVVEPLVHVPPILKLSVNKKVEPTHTLPVDGTTGVNAKDPKERTILRKKINALFIIEIWMMNLLINGIPENYNCLYIKDSRKFAKDSRHYAYFIMQIDGEVDSIKKGREPAPFSVTKNTRNY